MDSCECSVVMGTVGDESWLYSFVNFLVGVIRSGSVVASAAVEIEGSCVLGFISIPCSSVKVKNFAELIADDLSLKLCSVSEIVLVKELEGFTGVFSSLGGSKPV